MIIKKQGRIIKVLNTIYLKEAIILISKLFKPYSLLGNSKQLGDLPGGQTIFRKTVAIAWPAVLESFLISIVAMVDNIMVSSLGTYAIAAIGLTTQPKFIGFAIIISILPSSASSIILLNSHLFFI